MLKPEVIQRLKPVNISKNPEVTKTRIKEIWLSLEKSKREEILMLSDLKRTSIERICREGTVTARAVLAMAQVLDIDPNYFTGASDEQGSFSDDTAKEFLTALGYDIGKDAFSRKKLTAHKEAKTEKVDVPTAENNAASPNLIKNSDDEQEEPDHSTETLIAESKETAYLILKSLKEMHGKIDELSQDDTIQLLNSLAIQAKYSPERKAYYDIIKCMLLS